MSEASDHDIAECVHALERAQEFLHDEMSEEDCEELRRHLNACERCMENFDVEVAITALLRRYMCGEKAPDALREAVSALRVRPGREEAPDENPGPVTS